MLKTFNCPDCPHIVTCAFCERNPNKLDRGTLVNLNPAFSYGLRLINVAVNDEKNEMKWVLQTRDNKCTVTITTNKQITPVMSCSLAETNAYSIDTVIK